MTQPIRIPDKDLIKFGFEEDDVKNLSEVVRFLESCETTGMDSRFWQVINLLGRAKEMTLKMVALLESLEAKGRDREDILSIFMADEESRIRQAEEQGRYHSVILYNRARAYFNMKPIPELPKPVDEK